jgi:hypothetical protein
MLTLAEKLFLLSIDDDDGAVAPFLSETLCFGVAGALIAELGQNGKIAVQDKKLEIIDNTPPGTEALDEALELISEEREAQKTSHWVKVLASRKPKKKIASQLAAKNVLTIQEKRYIWVIPFEEQAQPVGSAKYWVKNHLRSVVLACEEPEQEDIVLFSLLKACRMLDLVFTRDEQKAARRRVDELVKAEVFGKAVAKTLAVVEAARV